MKSAREEDPEGQAAYQRRYVQEHPEIYRESSKKSKAKLKEQIVRAYGGQCSCPLCGEKILNFLTIDHINDDGATDRQPGNYRSGHALYVKLKREGFPKDRYRLLCFNCNLGRAVNGGVCPHLNRTGA